MFFTSDAHLTLHFFRMFDLKWVLFKHEGKFSMKLDSDTQNILIKKKTVLEDLDKQNAHLKTASNIFISVFPPRIFWICHIKHTLEGSNNKNDSPLSVYTRLECLDSNIFHPKSLSYDFAWITVLLCEYHDDFQHILEDQSIWYSTRVVVTTVNQNNDKNVCGQIGLKASANICRLHFELLSCVVCVPLSKNAVDKQIQPDYQMLVGLCVRRIQSSHQMKLIYLRCLPEFIPDQKNIVCQLHGHW